jgi:hypothetical protein
LVRRWWMHHAALDVLAGAHNWCHDRRRARRALFEPVDAVETVVMEGGKPGSGLKRLGSSVTLPLGGKDLKMPPWLF